MVAGDRSVGEGVGIDAGYQHISEAPAYQDPDGETVDVISGDGRLNRPCIELTIGPGYERIPPRVHRTVAEFDFGTRPDLSGSRGRPRHWTLVVV